MQSSNIPIVQRLAMAALLGAIPTLVAEAQAQPSEELATDSVRVAARTIQRGAMLTQDDIAYERKVNPAGRATPHSVAVYEMDRRPASEKDALVGWTARRLINTGEPLRAPAVISPRLVGMGDVVDVIWKDGSIVVTAKGKATRAAGAGERIAVRLDERRTVEGLVVAPGKVRVE